MKTEIPPLKVLHIVEATTAGVGRHVLDLSTRMVQAGLNVTVACPLVRETAHQDVAFVSRLRAAGVSTVIVPMKHNIRPLADLRACTYLTRLVRREGYQVVHAHSSKAGVLGRLAAWRARAPVIVYTPNAFAFLGARNWWTGWFYRDVERLLGHHMTDCVVCVGPSELALARRESIAAPTQLAMIENAIDTAPFAPKVDRLTARAALGLEAHQPTLGFVGRLTPQKGIEYLVQAARLVVDTWGDARFVLVGEGELMPLVRQMIVDHRLKKEFLLTGYRADIPVVLQALDVFVLPSLYEGLPYTLMEAMAAGKAVIATDVVGNQDLVLDGETGLIIPPRDVKALANAMIRLLSSSEERERLARKALSTAQARPSPEQMTRQVTTLYQDLLATKTGDCPGIARNLPPDRSSLHQGQSGQVPGSV
jgi:glycosyltransferase involved in cell wall biosynthesis